MPRVKFDYVVSFSSEDPDNQANNLLATEISKKKWLCTKGEPSCSVVLQMSKAVKISAVHIGAYQASLVEVLVGRSETPSEPYQVLVASTVFLSPSECRREQCGERVRSFTAEQLSSPARAQRWDRLRVLCSQPYNKHCKYGLSFVHIFEPEGTEASRCPVLPQRLLNLDTFSSDEDDFRPGELFAKHIESSQESGNGTSATTEVQIKQATSQALRNVADDATKLKKMSLSKPSRHSDVDSDRSNTNRHRDSLLYEDDDGRPNSKVDRIMQRHLQSKKTDESANVNKTISKKNTKDKNTNADLNVKKQERHKSTEYKHRPVDKPALIQTLHSNKDEDAVLSSNKKQEIKKRTHSDTEQESKSGGRGRARHELLRGAVVVLSGYANPQRARLRTAALALGARCQPDWGPHCTHLICAFPNTPKLRQVRAQAGGGAVPAARGEWLEQCAARGRVLPWQWFATEDSRRITPSEQDLAPDDELTNTNSECDTDDEIEKVLQKQKKQRTDNSPQQALSPSSERSRDETRDQTRDRPRDQTRDRPRDQTRDRSRDGTARGDRIHREEEDGACTDPDTDVEQNVQIEESKALPEFFEGLTFVVRSDVTERRLVERYVRAYGGLLLDDVQVSEGCEAQYVVGGGGRGAVRAEWVWRCHADQSLCAHDDYVYT